LTPLRRLKTASEYFAGGRFAESEAICGELAAEGFRSPELAALYGELLALRNRPGEAGPWLREALVDLPGSRRLLALLAQCLARGGELGAAADLYRSLGRTALAETLTRLAPEGWYRVAIPAAGAERPWLPDLALPLVTAEINGVPGRFLLDTGVGETLIDPALAAPAGLEALGEEPIHFPSGPAGLVHHSLIHSLALGPVRLQGVPAQVYATREAFAALLALPVDGIIGTGVLSRVVTTLDYRARVLRLGAAATPGAGTPFYLAGDHYPLVPARINDRLDILLFLDTGMSGAAAGFPISTARAAELEVALGIEGEGFGVDHSLAAQPLLCRSLEVAGLRREHLIGMLLPSFRLERRFGFRIGGLLGDGFINAAALTLDFDAMRLGLSIQG
jgi:hypothetical protein